MENWSETTGANRVLLRKPTFPPHISWQQLRQQEASGMDLEDKEETDNTEGEPLAP